MEKYNLTRNKLQPGISEHSCQTEGAFKSYGYEKESHFRLSLTYVRKDTLRRNLQSSQVQIMQINNEECLLLLLLLLRIFDAR